MKKTCSIFALILLLAMSLCTPALAASEYGVIYDETDELGSDTLTMQGEQVLPELSEKLGIDLRVDVLTQTSYDSISFPILLPGSMTDMVTVMERNRKALR